MHYTYDELRARISILEFAQAHGYVLNRKKGLKWPVLEHASGDRVIIINPRQSQNQGYFNPGYDRDKGTLIQFVANRLGWLFPKDTILSDTAQINKVLHEWLQMPFRSRLYRAKSSMPSRHGSKVEEAVFNKALLKPLKDYNWLMSRGISKPTIESPLFNNAIFQYRSGSHLNTAFPYRTKLEGEIVGAEVRNHQYKGHMTGSRKTDSIWISQPAQNCRRIIICESALDCLSHYELNPDPGNVYVSFGGHLTQGQLRAIQNLHNHLSKQSSLEVYIGVDTDNKGDDYTRMIEQLLPQSNRLTMEGKDLNEQLINRPIKTKNGKGRLRLVGFDSMSTF
jgi:hypothetical protein